MTANIPEDNIQELVHYLAERVNALDRGIRAAVSDDSGESVDDRSWRLVQERTNRQSLFKDLDWRVRAHSISYDHLGKLLRIALAEVEKFSVAILNLQGLFARDRKLAPRRDRLILREILDEIIDLFEFTAAEKGISFRVTYSADPVIMGERLLIERMLVNLVDNACKYSFSPEGSSGPRFVQIDCRRHTTDAKWLIGISSYGVGVLPDELASGSIYEYGTRGRLASDRQRSGTGIGLAEAKRIAEAHGGSLWLESEPKGKESYLTTAKVVLPGEATR